MKKVFSVALAAVMLMAMSFSAFAFKGEAFEAEPLEGFKEEELYISEGEGATFIADSDYDYRFYQVFSSQNNSDSYTAEEYFDEKGEDGMAQEILEGFDANDELEIPEVESVTVKTLGGYEGIYAVIALTAKGESESYLKMVSFMIVRHRYTIYVNSYAETEEEALDLLRDVVKEMNISASEPRGKTVSTISAIVVLAVFGAIIGGIVGAVNSSKKKKQMKKLQQLQQQQMMMQQQYPQQPQYPGQPQYPQYPQQPQYPQYPQYPNSDNQNNNQQNS